MRDVYKMIGRLATIDVPALVLGEHGTGKRLVIATIHDNSPRRDRPFLSIDCRTLPDAAIEAELFERATGTVQLAGVESLPLALQSRLTLALGHDASRGGSRLQARVHRLDRIRPGRRWWRRGRSAASCIRPLASSRFDFRRFAIGATTFRCWSGISCSGSTPT